MSSRRYGRSLPGQSQLREMSMTKVRMRVQAAMLSIFSVETLDTRLEASSDVQKEAIVARSHKSLWTSPEFWVYIVCFLVCVPLMIKAPYDVSQPSNPNWDKFSQLLTPGWMGRPVDNSDLQYQGFRNNFPVLAGLVVCDFLLRQVASRLQLSRLSYDLLFGLIFITALHGISAVKIIAITFVNLRIARTFDIRTAKALTWTFCVGLLFANEWCGGYPLGGISPKLSWLDALGIMPRWEVFFKCSILRMISFNFDYLTMKDALLKGVRTPEIEKQKRNEEWLRLNTPRPEVDYSFSNFLSYVLYAPLYLAGPIVSFNDYMAQTERRLPSTTFTRTFRYAIRFFISLLCMELIMHYTYVVAISSERAWDGATPFQISMIALFNLAHIWLKLLLPWRFFRLWALVDGIDPPENMIRCVANNYSALAFWRSWHRSFHKWVVRYLYVPLGGSGNSTVNSLIVFTFVAIWHDIQLRLLIWGWLVVFFVLPEILASRLLPVRKFGGQWWYRHVCALGGVANVWMMMIANLVGFAVGVDGIKEMLYDMFHTAAGLSYVILASTMLFVGVQVMFELRESEKRRGIDLKC